MNSYRVASRELVEARKRLIDSIELPTLPPVPVEEWRSAGVSGAELTAFAT
jgi:hypothetical protein